MVSEPLVMVSGWEQSVSHGADINLLGQRSLLEVSFEFTLGQLLFRVTRVGPLGSLTVHVRSLSSKNFFSTDLEIWVAYSVDCYLHFHLHATRVIEVLGTMHHFTR